MKRLVLASAAVILCGATAPPPAYAARLTKADTAWIDACVVQRKSSGQTPARLKRYCTCMQEIVENNQPFETPTELARAYPPAHQACWDKATSRK